MRRLFIFLFNCSIAIIMGTGLGVLVMRVIELVIQLEIGGTR